MSVSFTCSDQRRGVRQVARRARRSPGSRSLPRNDADHQHDQEPVVVGERRRGPPAFGAEAGVRERHRRVVDATPRARRAEVVRPRASMRGNSSERDRPPRSTRALIATVASRPPTSPRRTAWPSATGPTWMRDGLVSLAAMSFCAQPEPREITRPRIDASVSTPMPPMFTPMKTSALPNGDQYVAMSTVDRPVTQIDRHRGEEGVGERACCCARRRAIGSENSRVKTQDQRPRR